MDVQGTWENYGFFLRPTAFYDVVYADNDLDFRNLDSEGKDQLDYDIDILDAFVYGNWDIDGHYTMLRFGKQALNWGESLFIQGGVNAFQALDVTRIRTPGAELKDALTPMPMIFASTMVTPNFSVEAFWQFAYEETELDPAGSFFSPDMPFGVSDLEQNASQLWGTSDPIPEFLGSDTANDQQVSIGIDADYQSTYRASLSYTNIFGAGFNNPTFDRDFVMASVSYAF
jgi:hypothetical protein